MAAWEKPPEIEHKCIDFAEIKRRCDLREIIPPYLEQARPVSGGEYWLGCCPFHEDRRPSFLVYKEYYRCLSPKCDEWGSVIDWYSHIYPALSLPEIAEKVLAECACPGPLPVGVKEIRIQRDAEEPLPDPMDVSVLNHYPLAPWARKWVQDKWLLSDDTIDRERIGYSAGDKAVVIPVWGDSYEDLITLRFRNIASPHRPKYWGIKGRNGVYGYGRMWVRGARYGIVVFGEMTALFLHAEWGFSSFSWTNGCRSFRPYLKKLLAHLSGGVVVPDIGEEDQAFLVAQSLGPTWEIAFLDSIWDSREGDVIDWVKAGGTRGQFCDLIMNRTVKADGLRKFFSDKFGYGNWVR